MSDLLTKEEIDALLGDGDTGAAETPAAGDAVETEIPELPKSVDCAECEHYKENATSKKYVGINATRTLLRPAAGFYGSMCELGKTPRYSVHDMRWECRLFAEKKRF